MIDKSNCCSFLNSLDENLPEILIRWSLTILCEFNIFYIQDEKDAVVTHHQFQTGI